MYGAILGDIIGSPYEFDRGNKSKDFPLFSAEVSHNHPEGIKGAEATIFLARTGSSKAAIAGSIAEGFYGVPEDLKAKCRDYLDENLGMILRYWDEFLENRRK